MYMQNAIQNASAKYNTKLSIYIQHEILKSQYEILNIYTTRNSRNSRNEKCKYNIQHETPNICTMQNSQITTRNSQYIYNTTFLNTKCKCNIQYKILKCQQYHQFIWQIESEADSCEFLPASFLFGL